MGEVISKINPDSIFASLDWIWKSFHRESSLLILGLDNAGKTAILYSLQLGESISYTIPTIGFNVEQVEIGNLNIKMWDIGGQDKIRELWPHYYQQTSGIVFVVDSNDRVRLTKASEELHALISHKDNVGKPFLVLANKQDLPNAVSKDEIIKTFQLETVKTSQWYVIECSAVKNQRARLGFQWIAGQI
jgi:small GTP-binding protein